MSSRYPVPKSVANSSGGYQPSTPTYDLGSFEQLVNGNPDFRRLVNYRPMSPNTSFVMNMRRTFPYVTRRVANASFGRWRFLLTAHNLLNRDFSNHYFNPNGWTQIAFCIYPMQYVTFSGLNCSTAKSSASGRLPLGTLAPGPGHVNMNTWGDLSLNSGGNEVMGRHGRWTRPLAIHTRTPAWYRLPTNVTQPNWSNPLPVPGVSPQIDLPLNPPFELIPYRVSADTTEGTHTGPTPRPRPKESGWDPPGPPPPGTREKKARLSIPFVLGAQRVAYATTEFLDFLECLHKALPKKFRAKPTHRLGTLMGGEANNPNALVSTPQEDFMAVWNHWDHINWSTTYEEGETYGWEKTESGWDPKIVPKMTLRFVASD